MLLILIGIDVQYLFPKQFLCKQLPCGDLKTGISVSISPLPPKEEVNASLGRSCSEKQEIQEFIKASEILMQRNAADLGKIKDLFQKYGYKPHVKDSTGNISWQYSM